MGMDFNVKGWGGQAGKVIGKCKYCKMFSFADIMSIDKTDQKPYHPKCKENFDREQADVTQNLSEGEKNAK